MEQEAVELGATPSTEDVEQRIEVLKREYFGGSEDRYRRQLSQQGLSERQVRSDVRAELIQENVYEEVTKDVTVRKAEVSARFRKTRHRYVWPASRRVRHISVRRESVADRLYRRLKRGASFAALARRYSRDPSRVRGGRLVVVRGEEIPPIERAAISLRTGAISKPVWTGDRWELIQPLGPIEKGKKKRPSRIRRWIREQLLLDRKREAMATWRRAVHRKYARKTWYQAGFTQD